MNNPKILYVDDELVNLKLFSITFRKIFDVTTCESGQIGLDKLNEIDDIDIVISDMKMPGMNGIDFIRKARETHPDKKYYILTGFDITEEIKEALEDGTIQRYFRKPFDRVEIESTIGKALEPSTL